MAALANIGSPWPLTRSGGWALIRPAGHGRIDALGAYPTLLCDDWSKLAVDLEELGGRGAVSFVAMVHGHALAETEGLTVVAQVAQYLSVPDSGWSKHAVRNARRALEQVEVRQLLAPERHGTEWVELYACLRERHQVKGGFEDFPDGLLRRLLVVPGAVVFAAFRGGVTVGMLVWMRYRYAGQEWATYHLGAYAPAGYEVGASYALFAESFARLGDDGVQQLDLGRTPAAGGEGLARFKLGLGAWIEPTYCVGKVLRPDDYARLVALRGAHDWFPAYRDGSW